MKFKSTYQEELTNLIPPKDVVLYIAPQTFMSQFIKILQMGAWEILKYKLPIDAHFDSVINSYIEVKELQGYLPKVHCRFMRISYQRIKRMAREGVPNAQEVADRLAVLFEDPMHYQLINIKGNPHAKQN